MLDRVTFNKDVMDGQACIRNMRIPVATVIKLVASGKTAADIVKEYPDLEAEDIRQALLYAMNLSKSIFSTAEKDIARKRTRFMRSFLKTFKNIRKISG